MPDRPNLPPLAGSQSFIHRNDDAPACWMQGILWVMLADAESTGGRWSMMEQLMSMDAGPPPHKHPRSDEHLYMLDSEITFFVGDAIRKAAKGDFVLAPRNTRHAFRVNHEAAFLDGYTPAGLKLAIMECAMPAPTCTIPPKDATPLPNMSPEQYRRYGMDPLPGPNPLDRQGYAR